MKTNHLLKALVLFMFSFVIYAQEGANDPTFNPGDTSLSNGFDGPVYDIERLPDGKIFYAGRFHHCLNTEMHYLIKVNEDNSVDTSFDVATNIHGQVNRVKVQPDGKILIAGYIYGYGDTTVNGLARLNADGSLDTAFQDITGISRWNINDIEIQQDGKILVAGTFAQGIIRINANGTPDDTFVMDEVFGHATALAVQPDGNIIIAGGLPSASNAIIKRITSTGGSDTTFATLLLNSNARYLSVEPDGSIIAAGDFYLVNGVDRGSFVKISAQGDIDITFNPQISGRVLDWITLPDGKIIIAGNIYDAGIERNYGMLQLNADGSADQTFYKPSVFRTEVYMYSIFIKDNTIISVGDFNGYDGRGANNIMYFNMDGTISSDFEVSSGADSLIYCISDAGNGNMLIGGNFAYYNGSPKNILAVINADGELVEGFNTGSGPNGSVSDILRQSNGKYILNGGFTTYNGVDAYYLARINEDGSLDTTYNAHMNFNRQESNYIFGVFLQPDNKLVIYGMFSLLINNQNVYASVCRFNQDGTLDNSFILLSTDVVPVVIDMEGLPDGGFICQVIYSNRSRVIKLRANGTQDPVFPVFIDPNNSWADASEGIVSDNNGKFYIAQTTYSASTNTYISMYKRMDANGVFDDFEFYPPYLTRSVSIVYVQGDGRFLATSYINSNFVNALQLKRYNVDGSEDTGFQMVDLGLVTSQKVFFPQQDKLILAGQFTFLNGINRNRIARINSTGALTTTEVVKTVADAVALIKNNTLTVTATDNIASVKAYDLLGREVASAKNIKAAQTNLPCAVSGNNVVIVNITLENGKSVVKKIM